MVLKIRGYKSILIIVILITLTINMLVIDEDQLNSVFKNENQKVIYLTFDDGPSTNVTGKILDILKEEQVGATFFIVGYKIKTREDLILRMHDEGHSIGLHTYTHDFKKVYSSQKAFLDEMDKTAKLVKDITGADSHIIRFPGGSISRLNTRFLNKIHEKNYKIFDWNACISDGVDYKTSPEKLFVEATQVIGNSSRILLLMHCDTQNKNTYIVLPKVIDYYKRSGYEFKIISDDTPEFYFRFAK